MQISRAALAILIIATTGCASVAHPADPPQRSRPLAPQASATATPSPTASSPASRATSSTVHVPTPVPSQLWASALAAGPVVPWADLPYRSPVGPAPAAHPAGTPAWCTSADVVLGKGGGGDAAATQRYFSWPLLARPGRRCSLQGTPVVRESGRSWQVTSDPVDTFPVSPGGVLDAQHPGEVDFRWGVGSDGSEAELPSGPRGLHVSLPHHGGTLIGTDTSVGWSTSSVHGTPPHLGAIRVAPLWTTGLPVYGGVYGGGVAYGPFGGRSGSYGGRVNEQQVSAEPGRQLPYSVLISGPPQLPTVGPRCFGYRERLVNWRTGQVLAEETHELNCSQLANLPEYGRLFAMTLSMPSTLTPGEPLELEWQSDTQGGGGSSAHVTVGAVSVTTAG
jgi:hypothetical protein